MSNIVVSTAFQLYTLHLRTKPSTRASLTCTKLDNPGQSAHSVDYFSGYMYLGADYPNAIDELKSDKLFPKLLNSDLLSTSIKVWNKTIDSSNDWLIQGGDWAAFSTVGADIKGIQSNENETHRDKYRES